MKRQAALWAQAQGFSICAAEVMLPKCRYRADLAAYRPSPNELSITAIFECKQALADLRRDNCISERERARLASVQRRREILERNLRVHYPTLRTGDSLFPEFDSHDFATIKHRSYSRVTREVSALQNKLTTQRSSNAWCATAARICFLSSCLTSCFARRSCRLAGAR